MREIKLRAWDRYNEVMVFFGKPRPITEHRCLAFYNLQYSKDGMYVEDLPGESTRRDPNGKDYQYELMRYIGLSDRNGIEIYEGDIVRSGTMIVEVPSIEQFIQHAIRGVSITDFTTTDIIGNRFQMYELLKEINNE